MKHAFSILDMVQKSNVGNLNTNSTPNSGWVTVGDPTARAASTSTSSSLPIVTPSFRDGGRPQKRPRSGVVVEPFQRQLYELMVRQLHHDGFIAAASTVADAASVSISSSALESGVGGDRLSQLTADGMLLDTLARRETQEEQSLHVVERYMNASKLYLPLHLSSSWQIGGKMRRWRQKFTTSSFGGVLRDVCYSPDGAYAACSGTNGLALIFSLRTLEDVVSVEQARTANRRRGIDWSASTGGLGTTSTKTASNAVTSTSTGDSAQKNSNASEANTSSSSIQNANEITDLCLARRISGHSQSVEVIRFHPEKPLVVCGSRSGELAIHNVGPADVKVEMKVQDDSPVRTAAWHPSGEYVLFGTDHPTPRLLSVLGGRVLTAPATPRTPHHLPSRYAPSAASSSPTPGGGSWSTSGETPSPIPGAGSSVGSFAVAHHSAGLTAVAFAPDGRTWGSASLDGGWALSDGRSGKVVQRVTGAHSKVPVTSLVYSRTGNVLLTSGMDSTVRLWDLRYVSTAGTDGSSSRVASGTGPGGGGGQGGGRTFGALGSASYFAGEVLSFGTPRKCEHRSMKAVFSSDESHILCQDADLTSILGYCVYTGDLAYTLTTEPALMHRGLAASPFGNAVLTGGDDCRLRLWTPSLIPAV